MRLQESFESNSRNVAGLGEAKTTSNTDTPTSQAQYILYLNLFLSLKFGCKDFHTLRTKVEATLKSAWTEKDQIDNLLKERRKLKKGVEEVASSRINEWQRFMMAKRLCLVDDLKLLKITMSNTSSRNKLNLEVNDHYNIFSRESQEYELKTKDEAVFFLVTLIASSSSKSSSTKGDVLEGEGVSSNITLSHFRKNASSVSKLCFVCGSSTHLIKDCDFYEKQMANKTVGNGVGPVHSRNNVNHQNQFVPQAVLLRTGKVNIPPARPQPVPTGKPKVPAPVPTGRQNRPFPVPTDRGYSPSVTSGWWKSTARPMPHLNRPTSSYFQTYTPYVPQMYYNHMKYGGVRWATAVKPSAGCSWKTHRKGLYWENPYSDAEDEGIFDSGCSRSMTGNMERLDDFQEFQGGKVTFGGGEGRITGKGTIRTPTLDFENVYYVKELQQFNLFSISQICDKKNRVLFTDTDCLVLSKDFMLPDESMVVLRVPRKHNLYTINLNNLSPRGNLACLVAKASVDESVKWHRRMGHVNYKNMNRLVKGNLVRGLPPKLFKNDHTCVACCKGKQHKASYKAITAVSSISEPLQLLHMDLFGPTSIRSIDHKYYCLVITDDYSRFCWVFFLEHKDETYPILKDFINLVENQLNKKVKAIRCDNGTEFKNAHIIELCGSKGIKRDYSNARTPQQNGVAERKNRTLIEAARTMLADSKLPTMFWTEAVRTACYVLNRVLVTSPHNKTPYALLTGNIPSVSHFKPFGCHVTILNTSDHLGKFDGKADEGYIVGYSASNRAYRVYNVPNKRVEETMNLRYLEEKPNVQGLGHEWYFDLDYLTDTLGYKRDKANQSAGTQEASTNPAGTQDADLDSECDEQVIIVPSYPSHSIQEAEPKDTSGDEVDDSPLDSAEEIFQQELARLKGQEQRATSDAKDAEELQKRASTKIVPTGSILVPSGDTTISPSDVSVPTGSVPVPTGSPTDSFFDDEPTTRFPSPSDLRNNEPSPGIFSSSSYDDEFSADLNNFASTVEVSPVATKRINIIHPQSLIIGDHTSAVQTRSKVNKITTGESAFISYIHDQQRDNHIDFQHCLFACVLSQVEPRSVAHALEDPSWVDAMQEEMQQFKFQNVWVLVDLPKGKYAIGTKWILKNKRDARGVVVRNKARLVAQGHKQEEGIDYDEVLAPVARIKVIRLFLAFASYMGFMVYQMDVKSVFLYGRIDEEVYVTQPKGFVDPQHPKKVYKVVKALYGLHQAPRAWIASTKEWSLLVRLIKSTHVAAVVPKSVAGSRFPEGVLMQNKDAASSIDIQLICAEFSSIQVKTQADWMLLQSSYFNPQVPTSRVVVPTGRYVVPVGKVIIIVSPGRLSLVPTGRILSPVKIYLEWDPTQDIVNIVVNSSVEMNTYVNVNFSVSMNDSMNYVEKCNKCLKLKAELIKQHNMVEKDKYNKLSKFFSKLEQYCISLELAMQFNKEIFQKNNTSANQTEPTFDHLFELNNLKAELQAKYTTIEKLKANIKHLNKTSTTNSVKNDIYEIETINIELEHRVAKLIAKNEHLKQTYKQLYDSNKPSRVRTKKHTKSLVNQLNQKSVEITDLKAQLQEKVFVIKALKMILGN
ncbi:putative ribonuclease H-like domain-containing protein [Tanacetum coccineum]